MFNRVKFSSLIVSTTAPWGAIYPLEYKFIKQEGPGSTNSISSIHLTFSIYLTLLSLCFLSKGLNEIMYVSLEPKSH